MARRDIYHQAVRVGLEKEGWVITHDPYLLKFGDQTLQIDLGADMPIAAERDGQRIAIEIKSFLGPSAITDLYAAIGQFEVYNTLLQAKEADRKLYLALPEEAFISLLDPAHGRDLRAKLHLRLIVYHVEEEAIRRWIE